jgi:hypothetical protein
VLAGLLGQISSLLGSHLLAVGQIVPLLLQLLVQSVHRVCMRRVFTEHNCMRRVFTEHNWQMYSTAARQQLVLMLLSATKRTVIYTDVTKLKQLVTSSYTVKGAVQKSTHTIAVPE